MENTRGLTFGEKAVGLTLQELAKIALTYTRKGYNGEQLMYGDDLYDSTREEKEACLDLFCECAEIGTKAFSEKYKI